MNAIERNSASNCQAETSPSTLAITLDGMSMHLSEAGNILDQVEDRLLGPSQSAVGVPEVCPMGILQIAESNRNAANNVVLRLRSILERLGN